MAISSDYPGLRVEIVVDNLPLKEYDEDEDHEPQDKTVTKFIEASSGEFYSVRYFIPRAFSKVDGIAVEIKIDGKLIQSNILENNVFRHKRFKKTIKTTLREVNGEFIGQRFKFSQIITDETAMNVEDSAKLRLASAGNIMVALYAITNIGAHLGTESQASITLDKCENLHEGALKSSNLSHYTTLGPTQVVSGMRWGEYDHVHDEDCPLATFNFKYRSLAALKSLRIVPRTPTPELLEDRPTETLNREELATLVNQLRAEKTQTQKVKQENGTSIKRERTETHEDDDEVTLLSAKRTKRSPNEGDEVIVLD